MEHLILVPAQKEILVDEKKELSQEFHASQRNLIKKIIHRIIGRR
jgi:hypothetical protein